MNRMVVNIMNFCFLETYTYSINQFKLHMYNDRSRLLSSFETKETFLFEEPSLIVVSVLTLALWKLGFSSQLGLKILCWWNGFEDSWSGRNCWIFPPCWGRRCSRNSWRFCYKKDYILKLQNHFPHTRYIVVMLVVVIWKCVKHFQEDKLFCRISSNGGFSVWS